MSSFPISLLLIINSTCCLSQLKHAFSWGTLSQCISVKSSPCTLKYMQIRFFDWELLFASSLFFCKPVSTLLSVRKGPPKSAVNLFPFLNVFSQSLIFEAMFKHLLNFFSGFPPLDHLSSVYKQVSLGWLPPTIFHIHLVKLTVRKTLKHMNAYVNIVSCNAKNSLQFL